MRKLISTLFICVISHAYADYAEVPAECGAKDHCTKILSITTDVTTNFGYTRSNVKCGLWLKLRDSRPFQLIFHQPKNAPLHDVIQIGKEQQYSQNRERVVLKDEDTEAMLKFVSNAIRTILHQVHARHST